MDLRLTGKVVLVAGSSRGIGRAVALALLEEGANVIISGRDPETLRDAQSEFGHPQRILAVEADLTRQDQIDRTYRLAIERFGRLDSLIANLGTGQGKAGWEQTEGEWERLFSINFDGSRRLAEAAIPFLKERSGNILFISSITGVEATLAPLPYSAAKAALLNYSKNLARQLGQHGLRVNSIAPGNILFPGGVWERHLALRHDTVIDHISREVPLGRFGSVEEIASLAAFLCSERASFITGSCFVADGGQTRSL